MIAFLSHFVYKYWKVSTLHAFILQRIKEKYKYKISKCSCFCLIFSCCFWRASLSPRINVKNPVLIISVEGKSIVLPPSKSGLETEVKTVPGYGRVTITGKGDLFFTHCLNSSICEPLICPFSPPLPFLFAKRKRIQAKRKGFKIESLNEFSSKENNETGLLFLSKGWTPFRAMILAFPYIWHVCFPAPPQNI